MPSVWHGVVEEGRRMWVCANPTFGLIEIDKFIHVIVFWQQLLTTLQFISSWEPNAPAIIIDSLSAGHFAITSQGNYRACLRF